jgi:glycosyltransferase involved in cell wall biosynthesis
MELRQAFGRPIRVSFYVFFPAGGIGRYTNKLAQALAQYSEVSVEVACTPEYQWKNDPGYAAWEGLQSISHPMPLFRKARFIAGQFINPVRCINHIRDSGGDIVHFSNVNHLSFPYWNRRLRASNTRVAISVHDVKRQKSIINRSWEERQLKAVYRFADALFVHSVYQARELAAYAGVRKENIHVVPHGAFTHLPVPFTRNEARARLGLPLDEQIALFFGQMRDEKNLNRFIQALSMSRSKPHLVVAGKGGGGHRGMQYYQRLASKEGILDRITFMPGYLPDEQVGALFTAADWVALPYRNTFTSQSGVLNVAAGYDRPVLVSSSPVLQETVSVSDIGVACESDTVDALAEGIDRMAARVPAGYVHQFIKYRTLFSWEENARRTLEVYKRLLTR